MGGTYLDRLYVDEELLERGVCEVWCVGDIAQEAEQVLRGVSCASRGGTCLHGGGGGWAVDAGERRRAAESPVLDPRPPPTLPPFIPLHPPPMSPPAPLPKQPYTAIEYPGPVSQPAAILAYAPQDDINACFNAPPAHPAGLQLRFRGDAPGPPLRGHSVPSQKLLMKIVKRRRKTAATDAEQGVFRAEMVGTVNHTVRFVCKSVS